MASNKDALVQFEVGVTPFPMAQLTNSGDNLTFNTQASMISGNTGSEAIVRPNGVLTGGTMTPTPATNNSVTVSTLTLNLAGVETTVTGAAVAITRPGTNVSKVISITVTSAGALAAVDGTVGTDANFSEVRGAAGAPPLIPVGSVEVGQVRLTTSAAAAVTQAQIFQSEGTHKESASFPVYTVNNFTGKVVFSQALPLIHTGPVTKAVYASYSAPVFLDQEFGNDFVPAESSTSTSSEQVYGATIGSSTTSLGQASFTAILKDGITDPIISKKGQFVFVRFYQNRNKPAHILTQGYLGLGRTFNAAQEPRVSVTISPQLASVERAS